MTDTATVPSDTKVTDEEVDAARQKVQDLRDQIAAEQFKYDTTQSDAENVITKTALDAEAERLQAVLDRLKEQNGEVQASIATTVEQVSGTDNTTVVTDPTATSTDTGENVPPVVDANEGV